MLKHIRHKLAMARLLRQQRRIARHLQHVYHVREELRQTESWLLRQAERLALREIEEAVVSRRAARQHVSA